MSEHQVEPHVFVIIGATGDLTRRKLLPALYHLRDQGILDTRNTLIVGAALAEMGEEGFRLWAFEGLQQAGWRNETELRVWCDECLHYQTLQKGALKIMRRWPGTSAGWNARTTCRRIGCSTWRCHRTPCPSQWNGWTRRD